MIRNHAGLARRSLVALLAAAAIAASASAEDAAPPPDDPFAPGAFESGAGLAPDSAPKPKAEYLVGGSALVSVDAYFPLAARGYAATSSASGKVFGKVTVPDYGTLYASYAIYQPFLSSLSGAGPTYAAPDVDLDLPTYVLPELYYSFDLGKRLFVRLGKQLLAWGPSRVWSPVDFVNARRADFFAPIDLREGKPGLRLLAPLGPANVLLFADSSRSSSASGSGSRDLAEATVLDGRVDAAIGGFELGLSGREGGPGGGRLRFLGGRRRLRRLRRARLRPCLLGLRREREGFPRLLPRPGRPQALAAQRRGLFQLRGEGPDERPRGDGGGSPL
jgi:hypothetical protein